jgi:predicted DNA-binding ribbon-helix-helix protein
MKSSQTTRQAMGLRTSASQEAFHMNRSTVVKRSVILAGRKTSISIEDMFWSTLKEIARNRHTTLSKLVESIESSRPSGANLSSAIRVYVLAQVIEARQRLLSARRPDEPAALARRMAADGAAPL